MVKKNPVYGQGFNNFVDEDAFSNDPWYERYRYGTHYRRGPKNTDYKAIPPQAKLEIYDSQIGQLGGGDKHSPLSDRSYRSISGGEETSKNYSGSGPRGYKRADAKIWEDVCDALANAFDVDASNLEVNVEDSNVFLKGTVSNRKEKIRAEQISAEIPGVEDVHNGIRIAYDQKSLS